MSHVIGSSVQRLDIATKVTGQRKFPQDFDMEGQLHAQVVWAQYPHARVLDIDTAQACAVPGVIDVLTASDVPVNEYGIMTYDQPVMIPIGEKTRWMGDRIAVVVAETEQAAREASEKIRVEYKVYDPITDPRAARADQVLVHPEKDSNTIRHLFVHRGDAQAAFAQADVIIEENYETPCVEHAYLQPEACLGYIDPQGRVTLIVATQWPHDDIRQLAHILGVPQEEVRELVPAVGGAFGGREDMSLQPLVAVAVHKLRRPVKMVWTREESIRGHGKRHPFYMHFKTGCTREGQLVALQATCVTDAGAYESTSVVVLSGAVSFMSGPYHYPACHIDAYTVYTNNAPGMAMRGFGAAQVPVGYELQMDKMARALGMDPVEFRLKNILHEGDERITGNRMPAGTAAYQCLTEVAEAAGWAASGGHWHAPPVAPSSCPERRRGIGIACAYKNVGYSFGFDDKSTARVQLRLDDAGRIQRATVRLAAVEVGQGVSTVLAQIAAQTLDIPFERVRVAFVDSATVPDAGSCSASRHTYMSGNAVMRACEQALSKRAHVLRAESGETHIEAEHTYRGKQYRPTTDFDPETGECNPHFSYGYGAQAVLIEVDVETGQIEVLRVWSANNAGKVIHPAGVFGQSAGGLHMGLGWTVMEEVIQHQSQLRTRRLSEYHIPTAVDMPPEFIDIQVEIPDPAGPHGAVGMGETPLLSTAPALLIALCNATGIYLDRIPATPERVWRALRAADRMGS
jgi:CO/xanthine dehydrogenase Mo-binding subunit